MPHEIRLEFSKPTLRQVHRLHAKDLVVQVAASGDAPEIGQVHRLKAKDLSVTPEASCSDED